jgi:hypothetical protein
MKSGTFNHIVLATPTVDISNLDTTKVKPSDNTEAFKQKIATSCKNMIKVAERALAEQPDLEKVTTMNHAPRYDASLVDPVGLKPIIANFANNYLLELWLDSPMKDKIFIGSHNLDCSGDIRTLRYKDENSGRFDGVHLYSAAGKAAYTESVINILLSSFPSKHSGQSQSANDDTHTTCPQTKYNESKKRTYSSAVTGKSYVKTQNRFSPLSENC